MASRIGLEGPERPSRRRRTGHCARSPGAPPPGAGSTVPLAYLGGAVAAAALGPGRLAWLVAGVWIAGLCLPRQRAPLLAGTLGLLVLGGALAAQDARRLHGADELDRELTGVVATPVLRDAAGRVSRFDLLPDRCEPSCRLRRVRLASYDPIDVAEGERWRLAARLRAPRALANPGRGDGELRLWRQGVDAEGYLRGAGSARRLAAAPPPGPL
ncbi:MAG: DUF4131 domain-containing protein, partial [Pseudomonadales bacterium]|nr:DUF4131 domain-containing protein [Pseudomonadales bacterium]